MCSRLETRGIFIDARSLAMLWLVLGGKALTSEFPADLLAVDSNRLVAGCGDFLALEAPSTADDGADCMSRYSEPKLYFVLSSGLTAFLPIFASYEPRSHCTFLVFSFKGREILKGVRSAIRAFRALVVLAGLVVGRDTKPGN